MIPEIHEKDDSPKIIYVFHLGGGTVDCLDGNGLLCFLGNEFIILCICLSSLQDFLGIKYSFNFRRFSLDLYY